jgi:hypothetical protein
MFDAMLQARPRWAPQCTPRTEPLVGSERSNRGQGFGVDWDSVFGSLVGDVSEGGSRAMSRLRDEFPEDAEERQVVSEERGGASGRRRGRE